MMNIRYRSQTNAWPGFVDLFSNLVIILIFLLIMFVFLWTTTSIFNKQSGAKTVADLKQANAEQAQTIQEMETYKREANRLLMLAHDELVNVDNSTEDLITAYENKIAEKQAEIDKLTVQLAQATLIADQANINAEQAAALEQERKALQEQISAQTAELNARLIQLQAALDAAQEKSREQEIQYVEMSTKLNKALADKVAELNETVAQLNDVSKYQSEFYKAIKLALGDTTTVTSDGDRFIINSDILFPSGSYKLTADGKKQLQLIANAIKDMETKIPSDIDWIVRIDGHTDNKAVISGTRGYRNNTQLSMLRAAAVAEALNKAGVSKLRLIPTGFGDMYPVASGTDAASLQKNRRIELQLTNR